MSSSDVYIDTHCDIEYYNENTGASQYVTIRRVNGSESHLVMRGRYAYEIVYNELTGQYQLTGTTNPIIYPKQ